MTSNEEKDHFPFVIREFNFELQPIFKVNSDRGLMGQSGARPMQNRER
jgi:hypothetical protein